jgi:molybdopterin/thiamine biosynthesis adenylyltransferase
MSMQAYSVFISSDDWEEGRNALFTDDGCENAGVFLCGLSRSDSQIRLLARRFISVPSALYTERLAYHLEVAPAFYNSIVSRCIKEQLHPVIIHSHPPHGAALYSASDDYGESQLLRVLEDLLPGKVVASLVATPVAVTGRRLATKGFMSLAGIRVVGLRVEHTSPQGTSMVDRRDVVGEEFDRQVRAFGPESQRLLHSLHVGIVGLGGTGSIIAEQVVRVGVGRLTIVDNDTLDKTNLSRVLGATRRDVDKPKVDVAKHHLERSGDASIHAINDSAIRQEVLMRFRDCDLIFSCVDNDRSRALLNRFAHQYLVPVIDVGVRLDARSGDVKAAAGRVSVVGSGATCLRCSHHIDPERVRAESLPKAEREKLAAEGYVMGVAEPVPAVISLNATVAGLGATAFLNLFTNLTGGLQPAGQVYDATSGSVFPVAQVHEGGCDVCDPSRGVKALGDQQIVSAY